MNCLPLGRSLPPPPSLIQQTNKQTKMKFIQTKTHEQIRNNMAPDLKNSRHYHNNNNPNNNNNKRKEMKQG